MRFSPYLGTGNDIRYRTPAILGTNTFLLTLVLGIPLMMYGHIRWYWGFLLLPVLAGIIMALATSTRTIRIIYMVISAMGVGAAVGFLAMFVDVGFGACMGLLMAVIWGAAINHSLKSHDYNQQFANHVDRENKKVKIQNQFDD